MLPIDAHEVRKKSRNFCPLKDSETFGFPEYSGIIKTWVFDFSCWYYGEKMRNT